MRYRSRSFPMRMLPPRPTEAPVFVALRLCLVASADHHMWDLVTPVLWTRLTADGRGAVSPDFGHVGRCRGLGW
jgi:hypothetical protein